MDSLKSSHPLPDDIIRQTADYMMASSAVYKDEGKRRSKLSPLLSKVLGVRIRTIVHDDKTTPDGVVEDGDDDLCLLLVEEDKNEFGDGGSDPSTQSGFSAGRSWAQSKVF